MAEGVTVDNLKRGLLEFLELDSLNGKYVDRLKSMFTDGKYRLVININDLRNFDHRQAESMIRHPREFILAFQEAAKETIQNIDPTLLKQLRNMSVQIGFEGSFGRHSLSPRGLSSQFLNTLVEIEGIVTKCSTIRPKLVKAVQYCPKTKVYSQKDYRDNMSMEIGIEMNGKEHLPTGATIPSKDAEGNPLDFEYGFSTFKDYQTVVLQEMPERAKVGQLPRSVEIILEHDLVDRVKPGDRIQAIGVYRPLPSVQMGQSNGVFKSVLLTTNVSVIGREIGAVQLSGTDVKNIREVSRRPNVLNILSQSLCPSIYGHDHIKKALILQLLGGSERNLENGTHLRGDINVMLVGDPSTAKSQMLRAMLDIAPLAISTTGRGSSGVGLTAAVTTDSDSRERRLEAGAMVLADRGVVCIDEFDKMSENDRVSIHEVMEQQTVTIAKAGIHASLNARCSVLAAANPVYGQYDRTRRPQENIGLPDSLLSRFDLLFIVLDQLDPVIDKRLSEHVVKSHQYRKPGTLMEPEPLNQRSKLVLDTFDTEEETLVWLKAGKTQDIITPEFLRKYIHFAKNRIRNPELTEEAMEMISQAYAQMRSKQTNRTLPITARTLETMIRLSNASAKARLSMIIDESDVETALELLNFVLYHEDNHMSNNSYRSNDNQTKTDQINAHLIGQSSRIDKSENKENKFNLQSSPVLPSQDKRNRGTLLNDSQLDDDEQFEESIALKYRRTNEASLDYTDTLISIDPNDLKYIQALEVLQVLSDETSSNDDGRWSVEAIRARLNDSIAHNELLSLYSEVEVQSILRKLEADNKVMYDPIDRTVQLL